DLAKLSQAEARGAEVSEVDRFTFAMADFADGSERFAVERFGCVIIAAHSRAFSEIAPHGGGIAAVPKGLIQREALLEEAVCFGVVTELKSGDAEQLMAGRESGAIVGFKAELARLITESEHRCGVTEPIKRPTLEEQCPDSFRGPGSA